MRADAAQAGLRRLGRSIPDRKQRMLQPSAPIDHPFVEIGRFESRIPGAAFTKRDDQALENFPKRFAEKFLVSPIAMRKRLERSPTGPCSKRAISISPASSAAPATSL